MTKTSCIRWMNKQVCGISYDGMVHAYVLSHFSGVWLCNTMDYSPPGSSIHGILQARILEWVAMPSSRKPSWPRDGTHVSYVSYIGKWVLYCWHHLGEGHHPSPVAKVKSKRSSLTSLFFCLLTSNPYISFFQNIFYIYLLLSSFSVFLM